MNKPLQIGHLTFDNNFIQGPLAGISCAPFRLLTWQYSKPAFSYTEMISCKTLINQPPASHQRFIKKDKQEGPVCFQLSGNNPQELAEATRIVTDYGADLIDLNCGCPVNKIRSKGAGSKLLTSPGLLYSLITAMKNNTTVPISIKIRVEAGKDDKFNKEIAKVVTDAGADFLVVHGRHWTEHYETPCRHDEIAYFVNEIKIPVIGNGDIACINSLKKMYATGCAGVMIGRAGVGQPWLIAKLQKELRHEIFELPALTEIAATFMEHVKRLSELLASEKFAVIQARKFAKYYARCLPDRNAFTIAVNKCENIPSLEKICIQYFCTTT